MCQFVFVKEGSKQRLVLARTNKQVGTQIWWDDQSFGRVVWSQVSEFIYGCWIKLLQTNRRGDSLSVCQLTCERQVWKEDSQRAVCPPCSFLGRGCRRSPRSQLHTPPTSSWAGGAVESLHYEQGGGPLSAQTKQTDLVGLHFRGQSLDLGMFELPLWLPQLRGLLDRAQWGKSDSSSSLAQKMFCSQKSVKGNRENN